MSHCFQRLVKAYVEKTNAKKIHCFSNSKLLEILCALCKYPRIAFFYTFWGLLMTSDWVYYNRCFNDTTIFNHNFHIQEFARIYLCCHLYIPVIVIQFFEKFIWLIFGILILTYSDFTFNNVNLDLWKRSVFKYIQLLNICLVFK